MSYILDALRRADADRSRGAVPNIHAQPLPATLPGAGAAAQIRPDRRWLIGAGLAAAIVLAAIAWRAGQPAQSVPTPASTDAAPTVDVPIGASPSTSPRPVDRVALPGDPAHTPAMSPADNADAALTAPPLTAAAVADPPPALIFPAPQRAPPVPRMAAPDAARATLAATPASAVAASKGRAGPAPTAIGQAAATAPPRAAAPAAPATVAAAPAEPPPPEMPDAVRRQLPPLTVGGASYSENAASRMLILNGQVFREGDTLAPGLTLERIQLKAAVLRYNGQRYRIGY